MSEPTDVAFQAIGLGWEDLKEHAISADDFWKCNLLLNLRMMFDELLSKIDVSARISFDRWLEQYDSGDEALDELAEARFALQSAANRLSRRCRRNPGSWSPGACVS